MSIIPKRALPGDNILIHVNFHQTDLSEKHHFSLLKLSIIDPLEQETVLKEDHILTLPSSSKHEQVSKNQKYFPLLLLANRLNIQNPHESLEEILHRLHSGRHYYFIYRIPHSSPLGKHILVLQLFSDGFLNLSKTIDNDYFYVEQITLLDVARTSNGYMTRIYNSSPEPVPAKIVECFDDENQLTTRSRYVELPAGHTKEIAITSSKSFLLYNEERVTLPLIQAHSPFVIRNPQMRSLPDTASMQEVTYAFPIEQGQAHELTGMAKKIWDAASGLNTKDELGEKAHTQTYQEMLANGLIKEVWVGPRNKNAT